MNFLAKGLRELDIVMKQLFGTSVLMSFRNKKLEVLQSPQN